MPIKIPNNLPARTVLDGERIFIMPENRALHQDIRELKIVILNLMPLKQITEIQLLRLLGNTPLQIEIDLLHPKTYESKNISKQYLLTFYKTFDQIKHQKYDGMIITGAPVEHMNFEDVAYWDELKTILEWSKSNVTSTLHICWAAQAGLYYHYGINKTLLKEKMFGIFKHSRNKKHYDLLRGFDDEFYAPHSRHTTVSLADIEKKSNLIIMSSSREAGVYLVGSKDKKQVFVTGHSEYDRDTLKKEYFRDLDKGKDIKIPKNYFPNDDVSKEPMMQWRSHSNLLFSNWLNYYVYQITPYSVEKIGEES